MKIEHLRYFLEVGASSSFSQAARKLFISQQGLNKAITSMEAELDVRLIDRSYGGIRLTTEGVLFYAYAKGLVADYDAALDAIGADRGRHFTSRGPIELIATPYALVVLAMGDSGRCLASVREATFDEIVDELVNGDKDILAMLDVFSESEVHEECAKLGINEGQCIIEPLLSTQLGILTNRSHPLAKYKELEPSEVADLPIAVIQDPTIKAVVKRLFGPEGLRNVVLETSNHRLFARQVREGKSPGLLDSLAYRISSESNAAASKLCFIPLKTNLLDTVCFVYRAKSPRKDAHRAYIEKTRNMLRESGLL